MQHTEHRWYWWRILKPGAEEYTYCYWNWIQRIATNTRYKVITIEARIPEDNRWEKVHTTSTSNHCRCGRPYADPVTNTEFRFRDSLMDNPNTMYERIRWIQLPVLCQFCYYQRAILRGEWAPKKVRQELGLEDNML
jgi:hypothetical protein